MTRTVLRRQRWRYWAHRAGVLRSISCTLLDVPFGIRAPAPTTLASHIRRGFRAECPAECSEMHTEQHPCVLTRGRNSR